MEMFFFERREFKFHVANAHLHDLRNRFLPFMTHDAFCREMEEKKYCVRSIYFDTHDLQFYQEKLMGIKVRKKLRVRVYNGADDGEYAFLEIKNKREDVIYKERARIPLDHISCFNGSEHLLLEDDKGSSNGGKAIKKFFYFVYSLNLTPSALVVYEREAFIGNDDPTVRVTFDMNVRSLTYPTIDNIFHDHDLIPAHSDFFILEVKTYGNIPIWINHIIRDYNLRLQSISKYCNGVDAGHIIYT